MNRFINYTIALLWIYQGLIHKLIFINKDEIAIWQWLGLSYELAIYAGRASGIGEIIFGLCFIFLQNKFLHYLNIVSMVGLFLLVLIILPNALTQAFNPVVMNTAMIALSIAWLKFDDSANYVGQ